MDKLLKQGVDVNGTVLRHGETPLMFAARTGRPEAVKLLLEAGAKVDAKETMRQTTALMWAAEQGHAEVVKLLVGGWRRRQRADRRSSRQSGAAASSTSRARTSTPAASRRWCSRRGRATWTRSRCSPRSGADLNKPSGDGSTAMLVAIQNGHYNVARYLVEKGADINKANEKGWTPLYLAVKHRNLETGTIPVPNQNQAFDFIKLLLDRNVDVNARIGFNTEIRNGQRATWFEEDGATAFVRAALCGDIEVMRMLLAKGADPKIKTEDGTTALMAAAGVGYTEGFIQYRSKEDSIAAVKLLLELRPRRQRPERGRPDGAARRRAQGGARGNQAAGRARRQPDARIEAGREVRQLDLRPAATRLGAWVCRSVCSRPSIMPTRSS